MYCFQNVAAVVCFFFNVESFRTTESDDGHKETVDRLYYLIVVQRIING